MTDGINRISRPLSGSRVPFGERDGRLYRAADVPNGHACECLCPGCGGKLSAKNAGQKMRPHFAHIGNASRACFETAVHRFAKQVLLEATSVVLPEWSKIASSTDADFRRHERNHVRPAREWKYSTALEELTMGRIRPDVVLRDDRRAELLVEIYVRHAVDESKANHVRSNGLAMMEIDLSQVTDDDLEAGNFESLVLLDPSTRAWIHAPRLQAQFDAMEADLQLEVEARNARILQDREEALHRKEQRQARAELKRQALRATYSDDLVEVERIVNSYLPHERRVAHLEVARRRIDELCQKLFGRRSVPRALKDYGHDEWYIEAHPHHWRLEVINHFLHDKPDGTRLEVRKWVPWLHRQFGFQASAHRLFSAQQEHVRAKRERGQHHHGKYYAWYFTRDENGRVPNPFQIVARLEEQVVKLGLARPTREFHVIEVQNAEAKESRQRENDAQARELERNRAQESLGISISSQAPNQRCEIQQLVEIYQAVRERTTHAMVCAMCVRPSLPTGEPCWWCGSALLHPVELTAGYLADLPRRLSKNSSVKHRVVHALTDLIFRT